MVFINLNDLLVCKRTHSRLPLVLHPVLSGDLSTPLVVNVNSLGYYPLAQVHNTRFCSRRSNTRNVYSRIRSKFGFVVLPFTLPLLAFAVAADWISRPAQLDKNVFERMNSHIAHQVP